MKAKVFLDTNILLDHLIEGRAGAESAAKVFECVSEHYIEAVVSTQSIIDYIYISRRLGVEISHIRVAVSWMLRKFNVRSFTSFDLEDALRMTSVDIEDNAQLALAVSEGCSHFITSDEGILRRSSDYPMTISTAAAFLSGISP